MLVLYLEPGQKLKQLWHFPLYFMLIFVKRPSNITQASRKRKIQTSTCVSTHFRMNSSSSCAVTEPKVSVHSWQQIAYTTALSTRGHSLIKCAVSVTRSFAQILKGWRPERSNTKLDILNQCLWLLAPAFIEQDPENCRVYGSACSTDRLGKLVITQVFNKLSALYGSWRFITAIKKACHLLLYCDIKLVYTMTSHTLE